LAKDGRDSSRVLSSAGKLFYVTGPATAKLRLTMDVFVLWT